jgi:hypothetical protein
MKLIWANREAEYFFGNGWTGSISLIGNDKFADWRNGASLRSHSRARMKRASPESMVPQSVECQAQWIPGSC